MAKSQAGMCWHRDERIEMWLTQRGIQFEYESTIPLSRVKLGNDQWQQRVNVGGRTLKEELVSRYATAIDVGDTSWPPLVLNQPKGKDCDILDGMHRRAGIARSKRDVKTIAGYILSTTDEGILWDIASFLNQVNGEPHTKEEAIAIAVATLRRFPTRSHREIARDLRLKEGSIATALRAEKIRDRLVDIGISANGLQQTALLSIGKLERQEASMRGVADLAVEHRLTVKQVEEIVDEVYPKRNDSTRLEVVEDHRNKLNKEKASPLRRSLSAVNRDRVENALRRVRGALAKTPTMGRMNIHKKEEKEEFKTLCRYVINAIKKAIAE